MRGRRSPKWLLRVWGWWNGRLALLNAPILAIILAGALFYSFRCLGLSVKPESVARIFAAKLTFLSFVLAAGFIQYSYFHQMRWTDALKIRAGDWPHIRQAKQLLDEARASHRKDDAFVAWMANTQRFVQEEPDRFLRQMAELNRPMFTRALSIIFAIGLLCFASATVDLCLLILTTDVESLRQWSAALLVAAFTALAIGLVLSFVKLRVELIRFFDY